jgi:transcriptional regulator with XRE-family HTH domain
MISPYVRRLRLGMELRALRVDRNLNQDVLARRIGKSRMEISRLETGQPVDLADVLNILDALGVEGEQWTNIVSIAREACERGWWDSIKHMGPRQSLCADLEAGAATILKWEQTYYLDCSSSRNTPKRSRQQVRP